MERRAHRGRSIGRRIDRTATDEETTYADKLRRSAGWSPKHVATTAAEVAS